MATSAERQKEYRKRMKANGLVPVTGYVPAHMAGAIMAMMKQLAEHPQLEPALLRDTVSGKLVKLA